MIICGVDEAGRGPVIGPLVLGGVQGNEEIFTELKRRGVMDSKKLSPRRRSALSKEIKETCLWQVRKIDAPELDSLMSRRSLNRIEALGFAGIIDEMTAEKAYIDACDVNTGRLEARIQGRLQRKIPLIVEHKADERYTVVAAASILAKVSRDNEIQVLHKVYGDFGSGYTSDPKTIRFIEKCAEERFLPDCVRKKWKTAQRAGNTTLEAYY